MTTCIFPLRSQPTANNPESSSRGSEIVEVQLPSKHALLGFCKTHRLTMEQMIHVAWALVLRRYVGSDAIAFAVLSSPATADYTTYFTCLMEEPRPFLSYLESIKNYYSSSCGSLLQGNPGVAVNSGVCYHGADEQRYEPGGTPTTNIPSQVSGGC
jgi:hypothetical protein